MPCIRPSSLFRCSDIQSDFFSQATRPISHRVGPSVRRSVTLCFFAFLGILRVGKFAIEHAPAQIIIAPAQTQRTSPDIRFPRFPRFPREISLFLFLLRNLTLSPICSGDGPLAYFSTTFPGENFPQGPISPGKNFPKTKFPGKFPPSQIFPGNYPLAQS